MIRRFYVHNYRCLDNFDLTIPPDESSILILGANGSGKSTLCSALKILQAIGRGNNFTKQLLAREDFTFFRYEIPLRIELSVELNSQLIEYSLAFTFPDNYTEAQVLEEKLLADGKLVFSRKENEVTLADATRYLVNCNMVALPIVQLKERHNPIESFRTWIARAVLISPIPKFFKEESNQPTLEPTDSIDNFADWFSGVLIEFPSAYATIENFLKPLLPDFLDFQNKPVGERSKRLVVRFSKEEKILPIGFSRLSDGEKIFFVTAVLLASNKHLGPTFCFWDEPDSFVSLSEVGHFIAELRKEFKNSQTGQIFVTTHNPESIRKFSDQSTLVLSRESHLEPARRKWLSDLTYSSDLVNAVIRGDLFNGGK